MGTRTQINVLVLSLALGLGLLACGDDKEETPPIDSGNDFTEPEDAATPTDSSRPDAGTPTEEADADTEDGDTPDASESCEASKAEADEKEWAEGCYKCAPESNAQLLNSCATGWRTFDPDNYPSGWEPGEDLPAL